MNMHIAMLETELNKVGVPQAEKGLDVNIAVERRVMVLCSLYVREQQKNEDLLKLVDLLVQGGTMDNEELLKLVERLGQGGRARMEDEHE